MPEAHVGFNEDGCVLLSVLEISHNAHIENTTKRNAMVRLYSERSYTDKQTAEPSLISRRKRKWEKQIGPILYEKSHLF